MVTEPIPKELAWGEARRMTADRILQYGRRRACMRLLGAC